MRGSREWVKPRHGGLSDSRRITHESAAGEHVVIKGSERVTDWEPIGGTVAGGNSGDNFYAVHYKLAKDPESFGPAPDVVLHDQDGYSRFTIPLASTGSWHRPGLVFVVTGPYYAENGPIQAGVVQLT